MLAKVDRLVEEMQYLALRWEDEHEYEPFRDYEERMREVCKEEGAEFLKLTQAPFEAEVRDGDAHLTLLVRGGKVIVKKRMGGLVLEGKEKAYEHDNQGFDLGTEPKEESMAKKETIKERGKKALDKILGKEQEEGQKLAEKVGVQAPVSKKADKAMDEAKVRACPECGVMNKNSALLCEVCGYKMYSKEALDKELQKKMFENNKRLKNARKLGDKKQVNKYRDALRIDVAKTNGAYTVDKDGYAVQLKSTVKAAKKAKGSGEKAKSHLCPCCGEPTGGGSYFRMGHDGRTHGILLRMKYGDKKLDNGAITPRIKKMYELWTSNKEKETMRELAIATE